MSKTKDGTHAGRRGFLGEGDNQCWHGRFDQAKDCDANGESKRVL